MNVSLSEKTLAISLARALRACLNIHTLKENWDIREIPYAFRIYPNLCISFWKMGLAKITNGSLGYLGPYDTIKDDPDMDQWAFRISLEGHYQAEFTSMNDIEGLINFSNWGDAINTKTLLGQFLLCMVKIGINEKLPASRKTAFVVKDLNLEAAMVQLVENGFAVRQGEAFQWTDKIAVYMLRNYLWPQDEIIENRLDAQLISKSLKAYISTALNTLPHFSTSRISSFTAFGAAIALLEHWDGTVWHDDALESPEISFETAVGHAEAFLKSYKPSRENGRYGWTLKQDKFLTSSEKRLITSLAKVIHVWWARCSLDERNNNEKHGLEPPGYVYHNHDSTFESSGKILWQLGLAKAGWHTHGLFDISYDEYKAKFENPQDLSFPVVFKPVSKHKIDEKIVFHNFYPSLSILDTLRSFLNLASNYGGSLSIDRHSGFTAPDTNLAHALDTLVEFGYAERSGSDYVWTDKMSAPMMSSFNWTEDDFDEKSVDRRLAEEVVSKLEKMDLKIIPRFVPDGYLSKHTDTVLGFAFGLLRHWYGGKWAADPTDEPSLTMDSAIVIARKFLNKYKHNGDYLNHDWVRI